MFYKTSVKGFLSVMKSGRIILEGDYGVYRSYSFRIQYHESMPVFDYRIFIGHELYGIHLCGSKSQGKWSIFMKISSSCLVATNFSSSLLERQL